MTGDKITWHEFDFTKHQVEMFLTDDYRNNDK